MNSISICSYSRFPNGRRHLGLSISRIWQIYRGLPEFWNEFYGAYTPFFDRNKTRGMKYRIVYCYKKWKQIRKRVSISILYQLSWNRIFFLSYIFTMYTRTMFNTRIMFRYDGCQPCEHRRESLAFTLSLSQSSHLHCQV